MEDSNGSIVPESQIYRGVYRTYSHIESEVRKAEKCIYLGCYSRIWGHFITDSIKHVWFLHSDYYEKYRDYEKVYISNAGIIDGNYKRLLEYLDVNTDEWRVVSEITRFKEIIVPEESWFYENGHQRFTREYIKCIDRIRGYATSRFNKRSDMVYFSYPRNNVGEKRLQHFFHAKGFEIVDPGRCHLDKQMELLTNCSIFVSTDGSCCHNAVFCRDGTKVIIIPRYAALTGYQIALNRVHDLEVVYIDSTLSIGTPRNRSVNGVYYYYISDGLKKAFNDSREYRVGKAQFILYLYLCLLSGSEFEHDALRYYEEEINRLFVCNDTMQVVTMVKRRALKALLKVLNW